MNCPVCSETSLVISERQGVEIDYCPKCRGIWLDRGELDKIIEKSNSVFDDERSQNFDNRRYDDKKYNSDNKYDDYKKRTIKLLLIKLIGTIKFNEKKFKKNEIAPNSDLRR